MVNILTIDIETTGLAVYTDRILCVGVMLNDEEPRIFTDRQTFNSWIEGVSGPITYIGHNISFDIKHLITGSYIKDVPESIIDTKILSHYYNPHESHKLDDLAKKYLGRSKTASIKELLGSGKNKIRMDQIDQDILHSYCKQDVILTKELYGFYLGKEVI